MTDTKHAPAGALSTPPQTAPRRRTSRGCCAPSPRTRRATSSPPPPWACRFRTPRRSRPRAGPPGPSCRAAAPAPTSRRSSSCSWRAGSPRRCSAAGRAAARGSARRRTSTTPPRRRSPSRRSTAWAGRPRSTPPSPAPTGTGCPSACARVSRRTCAWPTAGARAILRDRWGALEAVTAALVAERELGAARIAAPVAGVWPAGRDIPPLEVDRAEEAQTSGGDASAMPADGASA